MRRFIAFETESNQRIDKIYRYFSKIPGFRISRFRHVTLSFLGDMEIDMDYLEEFFRGKKALDVEYSGIGGFPRDTNARVVWIGVRMSYDIMEDFKYPKNDIYHLTVGRIDMLNLTELDLREFQQTLHIQRVSSIRLYETILPGREYRVIATYSLV
ncbi:MAG: hypothetical protein NZ908_00680 [Candidatus Micrarchaeota archaeon]|nr:hypothetical protein [Candidatus Micrarchaeota archaeon]MCX8154478.1 hypothetical protein [Candidatus Micrarchaeota archaeon]